MSHSATLSPSPIHFPGDHHANSNFFGSRYLTSNFERRRTPHPHNSQTRASEEMPDRSQSQLRPRLEHRASQTVIDLTSEPEDVPIPQPPRPQRPPQLGRSDAVSLRDMRDFIDLTEDGEEDLVVTGERPRAVPRRPRSERNARIHAPPRADSPSLFLPIAPHLGDGRREVAQVAVEVRREPALGMLAMVRAGLPQLHNLQFGNFPWAQIGRNPQQAMPGHLNYQAAVPSKPEHVAPPAAREGFTRSPTEEDAVICPNCEEELVDDKDREQPIAKRGGKAPSRKEREEHPFWVVKECGHVSCPRSLHT